MTMPANRHSPALVLASSSPYRRALLERLKMPFVCVSPEIDEQAHAGEAIMEMVVRLSETKALAVAERYPAALIIGSDQALAMTGEIIGKPGSRSAALDQLRRVAGRTMTFYTGICVLDSASGRRVAEVVTSEVEFRQLSEAQLAAYLDADVPFDCAGSFKSEQLGIALCERISSPDPTALVGLPLISVVRLLRQHGLDVLTPSAE